MIGWLTSLFSKSEYTRKKHVHLSDEDFDHIVMMYREGHSRKAIAKQMDVSYSTVARIIRKNK